MMFASHCLTSLNMIVSRSSHVAADGIISFFFLMDEIYIYIYIYATSSLSISLLTGF